MVFWSKKKSKETLEAEAEIAAYKEGRFGQFHDKRSTKIGNRLYRWYGLVSVVIFCAFVFLTFGGLLFQYSLLPVIGGICKIVDCSGGALSAKDILVWFFTYKSSIVILFFTIIVWLLRRISRLHTLRAVHADKAIMANTMQIIYESGNEKLIESMTEIAIKEMFSSCIEKLQKNKQQKDTSAINDIKNMIIGLIKAEKEESE